jgi:uncharacterized membrane protein
MKSETRTQSMPKNKARKETRKLMRETRNEIRSIASRSSYDRIDILEMFVAYLFDRYGIFQRSRKLE